MVEMIQCPNCGTNNPPDQKVCQKCQTPLTDISFKAGQVPVRKDTGELEPILPQWLRDARESARTSESNKTSSQPETPQPPASNVDFLAGLQSQSGSEDEEEVPDWLANITGSSSKPKPEQTGITDTSGVRWVEMGKKDDFPQEETPAAESDVPPWLAGLQEPKADEKDELTDWFKSSGESQPSEAPAFDFLDKHETSEAAPTSREETPDWLKQMSQEAEAKQPQPQTPQTPSVAPSDTPDWLNQISDDSSNISPHTQTLPPADLSFETPDWLKGLGGVEEPPASIGSTPFVESAPAESEAFSSSNETPPWLNEEKDKKSDSTPIWLKDESQGKGDVPAWLASNEETVHMFVPKEEEPPAPPNDDLLGDLPDWLKAAAPQSSIFDTPAAEAPASTDNMMDWVSSMRPQETPEAETPETNEPVEGAPAFETSEGTGTDSLFTEMPDWLSNAMEPAPPSSSPTPITSGDALAPSDLPSWVEAMRPVEPSFSETASLVSDQTLESRGALAGLQGVLPAGAGFAPTSKPKAYSIKLNANEEQLRHAEILEQILTAETAPVPIETETSLNTSRVLRWSLAFLVLLIAFIPAFLHTNIFSLPQAHPNEVKYAVSISQAIPENAPVLVAFDYDPSRTGEMEAAAAPMLDNLLLLKHPLLTFIASNESGSMLAERLMTGPLAGHNYQSGVTYVNLGYLSGGQLGIRAFAQNPPSAAPVDISLQSAWTLPPLQGLTSIDHFAAMILISDNANSARAWVEQTEGLRGAVPLIVVTSAQAVPLIEPYYDSGQIAGIVPGLYGGAIFEQYTGGRPGIARAEWDAYSIGMLLALVLLLGGGLINMALGLRDRAEKREAK